MTIEHTPGPWVAHGAYYQHGVKGDVFAKDAQDVFNATPICRVVQPISHREAKRRTAPLDALRAISERKEQAPVIEANARLIAAAPDLLTVARMVAEASELAGISGPLGDAARAAIAKATGQS